MRLFYRHRGLRGLGQVPPTPAPDPLAQSIHSALTREATMIAMGIAVVSSAVSAYHGYRRHRGSVGAAIGWGFLGLLFPIITPTVALAEGYAVPKVRPNRRRQRRSR
jgi:hypothetical protein